MIFYLGTHRPNWLGMTDVPLFVSNRTLQDRRTFPRALGPWCLDSGGFSELSLYGRWVTGVNDYVKLTRRYAEEIGGLVWAACQDWMCEPIMTARTGLSVAEHQRRTVENFVTLRELAPELPFIPILQGWERDDYLRCVQLYDWAGVDLSAEATVGVGSVCKRHHAPEIGEIMSMLEALDLNLHGFGVKKAGLSLYGRFIQSSDSMAWSYDARRRDPLPGHRAQHQHCGSCLDYALIWRQRLLDQLAGRPVCPWAEVTETLAQYQSTEEAVHETDIQAIA